MKFYSQVQTIYRKIKRPANFKGCIKWVRFEANIMEPKLETIWRSWCLNDVAYSNSKEKVRIYIRVKKQWEDLSISRNTSNELTLNKHHGIQTPDCLKWLFVERCGLQNSKKNWRFKVGFNKYIGKSNDLQNSGVASNEIGMEQT